ncbi:AAA family ATPase [Desulfobacterales bacterium HSG2]|nr:AAA family ATPase [Desulfobacterales bacterium HSG2]
MKIISYEYRQSGNTEWKFSRVELRNMNLLVGDSGTGKTVFLNTIFNLAGIAFGSEPLLYGHWKIKFKQDESVYNWEIEAEQFSNGKTLLMMEHLCQETENGKIPIVERNEDWFKFSGKEMPKLSRENTSIFLLREEEKIKPLHLGFGNISRRNFSENALNENIRHEAVPSDFSDEQMDTLLKLRNMNAGINLKLYFLSREKPEIFRILCNYYTEVFPFIEKIEIKDLKELEPHLKATGMFIPVFCIKERYVDRWIPADQLSSGMKKVLLVLTDVCIFPEEGICLIDEYENSLGVNAINFFPSFLADIETDKQFIITSHHPYIINKIPVENWFVFHRKGSEIKIRYGRENVERFGRSKQQRFIQLINDPFYNEGVEQ